MRFYSIELDNWKNFKHVDPVELANRVFVIGPNASGKSNLLDVFRFLHDLVADGGGLTRAVVGVRDSVASIRSLHARNPSDIRVKVCMIDGDGVKWTYELRFGTRNEKAKRPEIRAERVERIMPGQSPELLLDRPHPTDDKLDPERLLQTALEQRNANKEFRAIADFFRSIEYMNLVPQLVREGQSSPGIAPGFDSLGRDFLLRVSECPKKTRDARLRRIEKQLQRVAKNFDQLNFEKDTSGKPHLSAGFKHWRGQQARQREAQFSDGTLRLIAMLWLLQEHGGPLLLEEPEWSLHSAILSKLASFINRMQVASGDRQVIISTHSEHLLSDPGIAPEEILLVSPADEGSSVILGSTERTIRTLMQQGVPASQAALPRTRPEEPLLPFDRSA